MHMQHVSWQAFLVICHKSGHKQCNFELSDYYR